MKKIFLLASLFAAVAFSSCKKDHKCTCTFTTTDPNGGTGSTEVTFVDAKKGDVKKACVKRTSTDSNGYIETMDCKLN